MKNHSWLNFLVFTCFLVIGYSYSTRFYTHNIAILPNAPKVIAESRNSVETMPNGQRSYLLIAASAINTSTPSLESIWLVSYFPSDTDLRMMPVFPAGVGSFPSFEEQLSQSFGFSKYRGSFVLDQGFIDVLEDNNYWWSGYFIFDEYALNKIANLMTESEADGKDGPGEIAGKDAPELSGYSVNEYASQIATLQSACQKFIQTNRDADVSQVMSLLADHFLTDLDSEQIRLEWDTLNSGQHNPSCKFPMLEISRLEP
jgi:hypothetical protein